MCFLRGRWSNGYTSYDPRDHLQVIDLPMFKQWINRASFALYGIVITPDLPLWRPLRRLMFRHRQLLGRVGPLLWGAQITVAARQN